MLRQIAIAVLVCAAAARGAAAQDYVDGNVPRTYYLHRGSTYQSGCWGPCACPLTNAEAMRGSFVLSLVNIGDVTDFYSVTNVRWVVPTIAGQAFDRTITGMGTFSAGQFPYANHQHMMLDLSISPATNGWGNVEHFDSDGAQRTVNPPVMDINIANSMTGCPGVRMHLRASWYQSDWNGDGVVAVQDVFDLLADYFAGRGDYNLNGATSVQDIFDFLEDYFGGA